MIPVKEIFAALALDNFTAPASESYFPISDGPSPSSEGTR